MNGYPKTWEIRLTSLSLGENLRREVGRSLRSLRAGSLSVPTTFSISSWAFFCDSGWSRFASKNLENIVRTWHRNSEFAELGLLGNGAISFRFQLGVKTDYLQESFIGRPIIVLTRVEMKSRPSQSNNIFSIRGIACKQGHKTVGDERWHGSALRPKNALYLSCEAVVWMTIDQDTISRSTSSKQNASTSTNWSSWRERAQMEHALRITYEPSSREASREVLH